MRELTFNEIQDISGATIVGDVGKAVGGFALTGAAFATVTGVGTPLIPGLAAIAIVSGTVVVIDSFIEGTSLGGSAMPHATDSTGGGGGS